MDIEIKLNSLSLKQREDLYHNLRKAIPVTPVAYVPQYGNIRIIDAHLGHYFGMVRFINCMPSLMRNPFIKENEEILANCILEYHSKVVNLHMQSSRNALRLHSKLIGFNEYFKSVLNLAGHQLP